MDLISDFVLCALHPQVLTGQCELPQPSFINDSAAFIRSIEYAVSIHAQMPYQLSVANASWFESIPETTRMQIEKNISRQNMIQALLDTELDFSLEVLAQAQIPVIVLKGADVSRRYYPARNFRQMGDIDLLVPKDRFIDTWKVLLKSGFIQIEPHFAHGFRSSLSRDPGGPTIDLHHALDAHDTTESVSSYWKNSQEFFFKDLNRNALVLSAEDAFMYTLKHGFVLHGFDSILWLHDLHYMIMAGLSFEKILVRAEQSKCLSALYTALNLLSKNWNTPIPGNISSELENQISAFKLFTLKNRLDLSFWFQNNNSLSFYKNLSTRVLMKDSITDFISFGIERTIRKTRERLSIDEARNFSEKIR